MKKAAKKRWVKALRSGKYKQGFGTLCQVDSEGKESFCCLGVLVDQELDAYWELDGKVYTVEGFRAILPDSITVGLSYSKEVSLIDLNDEGGASFPEIADWIEKNL